MNPKIAQTLEVLKLIRGMDYFSKEEQVYIAQNLIERVLETTVNCDLETLIATPDQASLMTLSESDRATVVRGLTHPDLYIQLPTLLEELTEFEAAPPSQQDIDTLQAENDAIYEQLQKQSQIQQENVLKESIIKGTPTTEASADESQSSLPSGDKWDVALITYDPIEGLHQVSFLRSGLTSYFSCSEDGWVEHENPYALISFERSHLEATQTLIDQYQLFRTPSFAEKLEEVEKMRKTLGKLDRFYILEFQHDLSNPVYRENRLQSPSIEIETSRHLKPSGLSSTQKTSVSIRWPSSTMFSDLPDTPLCKTKAKERRTEEKWQQRYRWRLIWHSADRLPIYTEDSSVEIQHQSQGNHRGNVAFTSHAIGLIQDAKQATIAGQSTHHPSIPWPAGIQSYSGYLNDPLQDQPALLPIAQTMETRLKKQIGTTPNIDQTQRFPFFQNEFVSPVFECALIGESKVDYRLSETSAHTSFRGFGSSTLNIRLKMAVEHDQSIDFDFHPEPTSNGIYKGTISLKERSWTLYQRVEVHEHTVAKKETVHLNRQHRWNSGLEGAIHTEECTLQSKTKRARIGLRLEKQT
ncbi:MAG: hypothetical protein VX278_01250 [Myxococcota bacterium]|nr:hypothetical protein [Myxococcota bacterium]